MKQIIQLVKYGYITRHPREGIRIRYPRIRRPWRAVLREILRRNSQ